MSCSPKRDRDRQHRHEKNSRHSSPSRRCHHDSEDRSHKSKQHLKEKLTSYGNNTDNHNSLKHRNNKDESTSHKRQRSRSPQQQDRDNNRRFNSSSVRNNNSETSEQFSRPRFQENRQQNRKFGNREPADNRKFEWGKPGQGQQEAPKDEPKKPKDMANMALSGKLAAETNTYRGVLIKYSEPAEAKIPKARWRLYPFKGEEVLKVLYIHRQSGYLIGKQREVADIPMDHPSISKQHAVLQFRNVNTVKGDGAAVFVVRPYIIDLESANGTFLNGEKIDPKRYYELKEKDVLKFGFSSREYVIMTENPDAKTPPLELSSSDSDTEDIIANARSKK